MKITAKRFALTITSVGMLTLYGCGGGGGGNASTSTPAASSFTGTAATGAAVANANVAITNSVGTSPCVETAITTSALGSYTCTLKSGQVAPFFVVVSDPTGNTQPLYSVATSTPAAGAPLTVNVTPLTTAIMAQIAPGGDPQAMVTAGTVNAADLQTVTTNVLGQLNSVLTSIGAPSGYNPFTTSITAATSSGTGNTADIVLDVVKVVTDPTTGKLALATVSDPTPILMATKTTTGTAVATPLANVSTLSQAAQIAAQAFATCFAAPTSTRVITTGTTTPMAQGGPGVLGTSQACKLLTADYGGTPIKGFLHNGYSSGQFFYTELTADSMTGAKFSVPEILAFYPADGSTPSPSTLLPSNLDPYDRAVVNIKYVDNAGNPGNKITLAARFPGTSTVTRPTDWWLVGNQQTVDVTARLTARRYEQLNTANTTRPSSFLNGIQFVINTAGPGSTNLTMARVSGPGLPGNGAAGTGVVYKYFNTSSAAYMDLVNKTGSLTTGLLSCGNGFSNSCPNLWLYRTQGITGTAATTLATNFVSTTWAQAADGITPSLMVKGAKYKVELFYGSNTGTADVTITKTLLSDMVPANLLVNLPWNSLGTVSQNALSPTGTLAAAQTSLLLDWVQNSAAQQISSIQAIVNINTGTFGASAPLPKGVTSGTIPYAVQAMDATTNPTFSRNVLLSYRMLDGSQKGSQYSYN